LNVWFLLSFNANHKPFCPGLTERDDMQVELEEPIRVLLADDHPVVRSGIRNLLEKASGIQVVGEASDGEEALNLVRKVQPDILLLDMEMPKIRGVEVAKQLRARGSQVRILVLSAYDDKQYILELLSNGASGYLTKEEAPEVIVEAVRGVARGEEGWVSRRVGAHITKWMREEDNGELHLTSREIEVLRLVVEGKTNQEIGHQLDISEKTVEKHLEGVFSKLGVTSRVEAAVQAVRESII
jgi:DNA-binding NarL/FixJ family response regulator